MRRHLEVYKGDVRYQKSTGSFSAQRVIGQVAEL